MKYNAICEMLNEALGDNFNIKYYANESKDWADILIDDMVHGVMRVTGGQNIYTQGEMLKYDAIGIDIMLRCEDIEEYSTLLQQIDYKLMDLNGKTVVSDRLYTFYYSNRSDASRCIVNGVEYARVNFFGSIIDYQNIVLSSERKVTIDGKELSGILTCHYEATKGFNGNVYGAVNAVQKNKVNSINVTLIIDLIWHANDELHLDLMEHSEELKLYNVTYDNGLVERTYQMYASITEDTNTGDKLIGRLTLQVGA